MNRDAHVAARSCDDSLAGANYSPEKNPASGRIPSSPPQDRTLAITVGKWGGFYRIGGPGCWRVCVGFVAVTYLRAEFANVMEAWLDRLDAE